MNKEQVIHENFRKELWLKAWLSTANATNCITPDAATRWADAALEDFDNRFPAPKEDPINENHPRW